MIIESVRMKNFKSHSDTTINFGPGINVILGENGAGKTTVLEAISFALFKDYSGNVERLIRGGCSVMEVEVAFSAFGKKYRVFRRRSGRSADSRLYEVDGKDREIRSGDSGVDEEIEEILGIDRYLFSSAIYVRQGEIERLLTETPSKRKQLIGKLLGIESLEKVWESMRVVIDSYRQRKSLVEGQLSGGLDINERIAETSAGLSDVKARMEKTEKSIESLEKDVSSAEKREQKLSDVSAKFAGLKVKKEELESMLSREEVQLERSMKRLSDLSESRETIAGIEKRLVPGWRSELEKKLEAERKALRSSEGRIGTLEGRIGEIEELGKRLRSARGRCPLCGSEITPEHKSSMIKERDEKLYFMRDEVKKLSKGKEKSLKVLEALKASMDEMEGLEKKRSDLLGAVGSFEELSKSVNENERTSADLRKKIVAVDAAIKKIGGEKEAYDGVRKELSSKRSEVSALRQALGKQQGKMQELEATLLRLRADADDMRDKKREHEKLVSFIKTLTEIRGVFDKSGLQLELRKRSVPAIELNMKEFFREFNFEYSDISLDDDYNVTLHGPSGSVESDMISGGERVAVALAMRLGIARALGGAGAETVMLDEPTIFLDEQRRQDLIDVIRKMTSIPQMIVVTHDPVLEDAADRIVSIRKSDGKSVCE